MKKKALFIFMLYWLPALAAASIVLENVRVWPSPDKTRIVFDLSDDQTYTLFTLENPDRVVIDIPKAQFKAKLNSLELEESGIKNIRHGARKGGDLRVVIDLNESLKPNAFILKPQAEYGHRLVVDLERKKSLSKKPIVESKPIKSMITRDFIVAIDAGHGGEDPGAIGRHSKTYEKEVVLSVAKKLEALIDRQPGMHAFLVRKNDYYVGLRKRIKIARAQGADLFISIHADSFKNTSARGASVFVLSESGASSEAARWLAESENRADLVGGISLDDKSDLLASVLLDLSQTANQNASEVLAQDILSSLGQVTELHKNTVQRAGFAVLKSPDVPSILVELGFLSNREQERKLRQSRHQNVLAKALLSGVQKYLAKKPKPLVRFDEQSMRKHQVKKGETLSEIAAQYGTSVSLLKRRNHLDETQIYVGQTLVIPTLSEA